LGFKRHRKWKQSEAGRNEMDETEKQEEVSETGNK
jgi:hypothetical protein